MLGIGQCDTEERRVSHRHVPGPRRRAPGMPLLPHAGHRQPHSRTEPSACESGSESGRESGRRLPAGPAEVALAGFALRRRLSHGGSHRGHIGCRVSTGRDVARVPSALNPVSTKQHQAVGCGHARAPATRLAATVLQTSAPPGRSPPPIFKKSDTCIQWAVSTDRQGSSHTDSRSRQPAPRECSRQAAGATQKGAASADRQRVPKGKDKTNKRIHLRCAQFANREREGHLCGRLALGRRRWVSGARAAAHTCSGL
jgi:hypothetical protein